MAAMVPYCIVLQLSSDPPTITIFANFQKKHLPDCTGDRPKVSLIRKTPCLHLQQDRPSFPCHRRERHVIADVPSAHAAEASQELASRAPAAGVPQRVPRIDPPHARSSGRRGRRRRRRVPRPTLHCPSPLRGPPTTAAAARQNRAARRHHDVTRAFFAFAPDAAVAARGGPCRRVHRRRPAGGRNSRATAGGPSPPTGFPQQWRGHQSRQPVHTRPLSTSPPVPRP